MNEESAKALIAEYLKWGECFNRLTELSDELTAEEARSLRRGIAEAEFKIYDGVVPLVAKDFPDLDPCGTRVKEFDGGMNEGTYTIAVRVSHATLGADDIVKIVGRPADRVFNVGDRWTTRGGRPMTLNGQPRIATETFCTFPGIDGKLEDFSDGLASLSDELSLRPRLAELTASGEVELFVGLFMESDAGFEFPPRLLRRLSDLGLSLDVCLYR